ncbi:Gfo/Idh/MocA family oxidoreductase [Paraflavisolibacter sp. H34]|uniref:Gfo/Idh/MocA family protein n=1 Tax=Huijunlia imazamoxiresistens TaxID=3127457 RepID=UPI0030175C10
MKTIQWGIIGCGDVTEVKSGPAFNKVPNSKLVAVMRRNAEKAEDYARRHGVPKWYTDARQLIDDPEVNAIYIATPPQQHEEYAIAALRAGKPVYVEKPMALNFEGAERMRKVSEETGVKLAVAHYRREHALFREVKELLDANAIGEVRLVILRLLQPHRSKMITKTPDNWRTNPEVSGGGLFHDLAPHQLDLMLHFFGPVKQAHGMALNQGNYYPADDLVSGNILFKNDVLFTGTWCFTVPEGQAEDSVEIIGAEGSIAFSVFEQGSLVLVREDEVEEFTFEKLDHLQQPMIEKVTAYFLDKGPNPCPACDGVEIMRLLDVFTKKQPEPALSKA